MPLSNDIPEEDLVRAREFVRALNDGAARLGLRPKQAQIGSTSSGALAVIMDFRITPEVFDD